MSLSVLIALVAFPMFVMAVLGIRYLVGRERRALLSAAQQFPCKRCGTLLSEQGLSLADALWERHMQHIFEHKMAGKERIVRTLDATCPKCGARYQFDHERSTFSSVEVSLSFERASR